jgi:autotransporter-associated beta strand protein
LAAKTTLDLNTTNSATFRSAITGDASSQITKSGSASITLSGVTNFAGSVSITGGALGFSQAATLGKLETNGGSLLIDAAAASGALTLGAAPTGTISLLVQNVGSIGDAGVRVFAEGSPMPTNVAIESAIVTDDQGSWVASYSNGVLTKTSVSTATGGDLTWKLDGASNNWGVTTAANWNKNGTAQRWVDGSSVTFAGAGESINVVSAVTATSAAITEGDYEWILGADKLTITNGVTVAQDASLTLTGVTVGDTANYQGVVTGAGTLVLKNMGMKTLGQLSNVLSSTGSSP